MPVRILAENRSKDSGINGFDFEVEIPEGGLSSTELYQKGLEITEKLTQKALESKSPLDVINDALIAGMNEAE